VTLIVPAKSNHPVTDYARRHFLRQLRSAGARVLRYTPGMMHAKAMIVDGRVGLLGSANFDMRSLLVNFEIGLVLHSEADVRAMQAWASELVRHSTETTGERKRRYRLLGDITEDLCRLFAPML
jgi:cardiolipin synthase